MTAHNNGQPAKALPAPAAPDVVLYDQYDNDFNNGIVSANRTDNPALSAQAADDFVVPAGQTWTVNEVDIRSPVGFGSPTAFGVFFYANGGTLPATPVYSATGLTVVGNPDYVITLTTPGRADGRYLLGLGPGHHERHELVLGRPLRHLQQPRRLARGWGLRHGLREHLGRAGHLHRPGLARPDVPHRRH